MTTHTVAVHKANLPIKDDESLTAFSNALKRAVELAYVSGSVKSGDVWPEEVYADHAVFCIYQQAGPSKLLDIPYTRNTDGSFKLGTSEEVKRKTVFEAVDGGMLVQKSLAGYDDSAHEFVTKAKTEKAEWDAAYVNSLPDAAFAAVLPGGKKDASGKTVPRSLRVLPHHDASVTNGDDDKSADLPHLRNALARVGQVKASPAVVAQARAHLEKHAKSLLGPGKAKPVTAAKSLFDDILAEGTLRDHGKGGPPWHP